MDLQSIKNYLQAIYIVWKPVDFSGVNRAYVIVDDDDQTNTADSYLDILSQSPF